MVFTRRMKPRGWRWRWSLTWKDVIDGLRRWTFAILASTWNPRLKLTSEMSWCYKKGSLLSRCRVISPAVAGILGSPFTAGMTANWVGTPSSRKPTVLTTNRVSDVWAEKAVQDWDKDSLERKKNSISREWIYLMEKVQSSLYLT